MNTTDLARMDKRTLSILRSNLVVDKMNLDRWFSVFLEENVLDHDELDNPAWEVYKSRLSEYRVLNNMIKTADYQIGKP